SVSRLTWTDQPERQVATMTIEKCINEFDVDDVIFEEGSTGRELFVVLDGQVEIAKMNGPSKTGLVPFGHGHCGRAKHPRDADQSRPLRLPGQPAAGLCADDHGCAQQALAGL